MLECIVILFIGSVLTFCPEEPELCSRCDSIANCETNDPLAIIPNTLPATISDLRVFYTGPNATIQPRIFTKYTNLKEITITGEKISSIERNTFTSLVQLERLRLHHTGIEILPDQLLSSSIKMLQLDFNKLTSIPHHLFKSTPQLTHLSLEFNHILHNNCDSIGSNFKELPNLLNLKLGNFTVKTDCEKKIDFKFFEPIQSTTTVLNLTLSNIYGGKPTIFQNFTVLEDLDISLAQQFLNCPSSASTLFNNLPSTLKFLTFRRWRTDTTMNPECAMTNKTIAGLKELKNLHTIDTKYSDLIFSNILRKSLFLGFRQLSRLDLDWCRFSIVEDHIFDGCPNLTWVSFDGNPLGSRPFKLFSSRNHAKLLTLTMTGASIYTDYSRNFYPGKFLEAAPLMTIDLSGNQLNRMPRFTMNKTTFLSLEAINLDNNFLRNLDLTFDSTFAENCQYLPNLKSVSLKNNGLESVEGLCDSITALYLADNKVTKYWSRNQQVISGLHKLMVLDISGNEIIHIKPNFFDKMPNLTELYIYNNNISEIAHDYVHKNLLLEVLDLRSNFLREIDVRSVGHLRYLRKLLLDKNSISKLNRKLLEYLDNLQQLEEFGIRGNALQCRCNQEFVQKWIRKTKYVPAVARIDCHGPTKELEGQRIHKYKRDNYSCDYAIYVTVSLSILGGIIGVILIVLPIYRYRWYIAHFRIVFSAIINQVFAVRLEQNCSYDAYVMYNSKSDDDQDFVVNSLLPAIENVHDERGGDKQERLKLYISEREILPGSHKHTEMLLAMEKSRKMILVLSNSYLRSSECRGQADLAGREAYGEKYYQPNKILVIVREKLNEDSIEAPFTSLLTENVIDVQDTDDKVMKRAWQRVKTFISKPRYEYRRKTRSQYVANRNRTPTDMNVMDLSDSSQNAHSFSAV